jgi:hypothetical protein
VTEGWMKTHIEQFHNFCSLLDISKMIDQRGVDGWGIGTFYGDKKCIQHFDCKF